MHWHVYTLIVIFVHVKTNYHISKYKLKVDYLKYITIVENINQYQGKETHHLS